MNNVNKLNYEKIQNAVICMYDMFEIFSKLTIEELTFIKLAQEQVRAKDKLD